MTRTRRPRTAETPDVVIAGSGVAGLEAALSLRALAGARPRITMVTPDTWFAYRPMGVREPFDRAGASRYRLDAIAEDLSLELRRDRVDSVQPFADTLRTTSGTTISYHRLLLALGPRRSSVYADALTIDDHRIGDQLSGLRAEIELGKVASVAFIAPRGATWALPLYELAFLTAAHAAELSIDLAITIATPEPGPLAAFGPEASAAVRRMLQRSRIELRTEARCHLPGPGELLLEPRGAPLHVDRIVAMPLLWGPSISGVPSGAPGGFVAVDSGSRVPGLSGVFAAGDMTDLPIKHGGLAAQQADIAAATIAAELTGAVFPRARPLVVEAVLLGDDRLLRLHAELRGGGAATRCVVFEEPPGVPHDKLITRRLTAYLRRFTPLHHSVPEAPRASGPAAGDEIPLAGAIGPER
jgi:sulfide:quinone oxidoreductase